MRNHPQHSPQANADLLQERTQRDQEERSRQALSNQGAQDRNPARDDDDIGDDHDRRRTGFPS